jgi:hypothetical protein
VFNEIGQPVEVLAVSDIVAIHCFRVTFSNGEQLTAGERHLWNVAPEANGTTICGPTRPGRRSGGRGRASRALGESHLRWWASDKPPARNVRTLGFHQLRTWGERLMDLDTLKTVSAGIAALIGAAIGASTAIIVQRRSMRLEREKLVHTSRGRVNVLSVAVFRDFLKACKDVERLAERRSSNPRTANLAARLPASKAAPDGCSTKRPGPGLIR